MQGYFIWNRASRNFYRIHFLLVQCNDIQDILNITVSLLRHYISGLEKSLASTFIQHVNSLWAPLCMTVHMSKHLKWWWPHYLSIHLISQSRIASIYFRIGIIKHKSRFQDKTAKCKKKIKVELVMNLEHDQTLWVLWEQILNIARLLRLNIWLICVPGYFLLKVNVEKVMSFEADEVVLESTQLSKMVEGQRGQRSQVLSLKPKFLFRAVKDIQNWSYYNLLVQCSFKQQACCL